MSKLCRSDDGYIKLRVMLIHWYRVANWLYRHHIGIIPKLIYYLQYLLFNCSVPASCKIGKGTKFGYGGIATVIHGRAEIGNNCVIGTCVTIGGRSKYQAVPKIGNNVHISTGTKILGPVVIGDNVVIGAGSIVLHDVLSNSVAVGTPAKVIKSDIDINDYI